MDIKATIKPESAGRVGLLPGRPPLQRRDPERLPVDGLPFPAGHRLAAADDRFLAGPGGVEDRRGGGAGVLGLEDERLLEDVGPAADEHTGNGLNAINGSVLLAIMALPTIISISEDSLNAVPPAYNEASLPGNCNTTSFTFSPLTASRINILLLSDMT